MEETHADGDKSVTMVWVGDLICIEHGASTMLSRPPVCHKKRKGYAVTAKPPTLTVLQLPAVSRTASGGGTSLKHASTMQPHDLPCADMCAGVRRSSCH